MVVNLPLVLQQIEIKNNGITFSCYDIDSILYTKYFTLDGYNIRLFRFISCLADADIQMYEQTRSDIITSNRNGLSVFSFAAPFDNPFLDETKYNEQSYIEIILIKLHIDQNGE